MRIRTLSSVAMALVVAVLCGCAASPPIHPIGPGAPQPDLLPAQTVSPEELETLLGSGSLMTTEQLAMSNAVQARFGSNASFSGLEWVPERKVFLIWWHGQPPAQLVDVVNGSDGMLEIVAAANPPAALTAAVRELMEPGAIPGVTVFSAGAAVDGSKLTVTAEPIDPLMTESEVLVRIEAVAGFPVDLEIGSIMLISGEAPVEE